MHACSSLQFGHGGEAVETMATITAITPSGSCFNSATAVKSWRQLALIETGMVKAEAAQPFIGAGLGNQGAAA
jgi:hypothetical protein